MRRRGRKDRDALVEHIIADRLAFAHLASWGGFSEAETRAAILGLRDKPEIRVHADELPRHMLPAGYPPHLDLILHADGSATPDPADPRLAGTRWAPQVPGTGSSV